MIQKNTPRDAELVKKLLSGDESAFVDLVEKYENPLLRYVMRFSGVSHECAEDVVQETFIKIYRNILTFNESLKFSSWAYRIAHNETLNYLKKHKKIQTVSLDGMDEEAPKLIDLLASDLNIEDEAKKKEAQKIIRKLLKTLPNKYREVLVLKYLEEKDYSEISDILKKPMGTVATMLNRAKKHLKKVMEKNSVILTDLV